MTRARRLAMTAALVAAVMALPSAPAWAQGVTGISLTPGVIEVELASPRVDFPFTIANNEAVPTHIDLSVHQLTQSLDGSMGYGGPSPLTVAPTEVLLQPGEHATVRVTGALEPGAPALYAGLLATPRGGAVTGNVEIRTRVAGLMLLTRPGDHRRSVEIADVSLTPTAQERTYRVGAVLRNTGEVHVRPEGVVNISEPGGPLLGTATLTGMVLLPGFARTLDGGTWTAPPPPLSAVRLDVVVSDPPATGGRLLELPERAAGDPQAPSAESEASLGGLGGGDGSGPGPGPGPLVAVALLLLILVTGLLLWTYSRRSGAARQAGAAR